LDRGLKTKRTNKKLLYPGPGGGGRAQGKKHKKGIEDEHGFKTYLSNTRSAPISKTGQGPKYTHLKKPKTDRRRKEGMGKRKRISRASIFKPERGHAKERATRSRTRVCEEDITHRGEKSTCKPRAEDVWGGRKKDRGCHRGI